jgi:hypothetical protein
MEMARIPTRQIPHKASGNRTLAILISAILAMVAIGAMAFAAGNPGPNSNQNGPRSADQIFDEAKSMTAEKMKITADWTFSPFDMKITQLSIRLNSLGRGSYVLEMQGENQIIIWFHAIP